VTTLAPHALAFVIGGGGVSVQGQTPLPGGGRMQGGFTVGTDGIGLGVQGQTPLPWGGRVQGTFEVGDYHLPKLPKLPKLR
jgi:hypothetical protein